MAIETEPTAARACRNRVAAGPVRPIQVPLWLGAERPGVELGATAIDLGLRERWRRRALPALLDRLQPTLSVPVDVPRDAESRLDRRSLEFLPPIADLCARLATTTADAIGRGELALMLGGDHALSVGSIAGAAIESGRLGVLWFDTHPDLNTADTSPSGHIHGMALAAALGLGVPALTEIGGPGPKVRPEDICLLGARDIDPGERALIRDRGIFLLTMEEWDDSGIAAGLDAALAHLDGHDLDAVHVSFDLDVIDPLLLPGTGTCCPGGLIYREAAQTLRRLRAWDGPIRSIDWVELNPTLDPSGRSTEASVALLATLLGESMR